MRDFPALAIFAEVVRFGSLTRTAHFLGISVSAVSKNVSKLEEGLGTRLINRNTRNLRLTSEGEIFYEALSRGLDRVEAAHATVSGTNKEPSGEVRVSLPNAYARACILPHLAEFQERYPAVTVEISLDDQSVDLIQNGFDVGVRYQRPKNGRYIERQMQSSPVVLVASPDYVAGGGVPRHPQELAVHNIINVRRADGHLTVWNLLHAGRKETCCFDPSGRTPVISHQASACVDMAVSGLGIAAAPWFGVRRHLETGRLHVVLPDWQLDGAAEFGGDIALIYPNKDFLPPRSRAMIDFLGEINEREVGRDFDPLGFAVPEGQTGAAESAKAL